MDRDDDILFSPGNDKVTAPKAYSMKEKRLSGWFVCLAGCCIVTLAGCNAVSGVIEDDTPGTPLPNSAPIAAITDIPSASTGEAIVFDASASSDSDGEIASYDWDFGDGTSSDLPVVEHVFDEAGEYTVTLTVTDNQGATDTSVFTVVVRDIPASMFTVTLRVDPAGAGIVVLSPPGAAYEAGTLVSLTATPSTGYEFVRFSGDVSSTNTAANLTVDANKSIVAKFALKTVAISVGVDPPGAGSVIIDPAGGLYDYGTNLTLTAAASSGFVFNRFVDAAGSTISTQSPSDFLAEEDETITARFVNAVTPTFTLGVSVVPNGGGSVTLDPAGGVYDQGTVVTITATPSAGYGFLQYSGDASGLEQVVQVTMDANRAVIAEFAWIPAIGNPGNLLVTGFVGKNVTEFDRVDGTSLGEVVASGSGGLSFAAGIDIGPDGNIYVVNVGVLNNTSVLRYDGVTGDFIDTFIDGGDTIGFFTLRFGPNGNLFVPDTNDNSIQEYDGTTGALVREFVSPGAGGLDTPFGLRFGPNGNLFVASKDSDTVIEYDGTTGAAVGTYGDLAAAGFSVPVDLLFNQTGDMFVTVSGDESVVRVDAASGIISPFVAPGSGGLDSPGGILFHPDNDNLLVISQGTSEVLEYDNTTGAFLGVFATGASSDSLIFMALRPK